MKNRVYVLGAGFSAGLGFPVTSDLLSLALARLRQPHRRSLQRILEFHFPDFRANDAKTYPNIEDVLTRIRINIDLFHASRKQEGRLRVSDLKAAEMNLLHALSQLFHDIRAEIRIPGPGWLQSFVDQVRSEQATIISFNWDLVLDVLLGGETPGTNIYAMGANPENSLCLLKPHGSLNWYGEQFARHFKEGRKYSLWQAAKDDQPKFESVWLFKYPREPRTAVPGRQYLPWIVPPTYLKSFDHPFFQQLLRIAVDRLGNAKEVFFLGFSMPQYDYQAEFMLRCGFHVHKKGAILSKRRRTRPSGVSRVIVVNPDTAAADRIRRVLGVECEHEKMSVATWIRSGKLANEPPRGE